MTIFSHIAAGGLAGAFAPTPYLAPVFGLGSHVLLDVIPHHDFESMKVEILLGAAAFAALVAGGAHSPGIVLGAVFGILPDLENLLWKLGKIRDDQKKFPGHVGIIAHGREAGRLNLVLQFVFSMVAIGYLVWRST